MIPDAAIMFDDEIGNSKLRLIMEVDFSESCEDLCKDVRIWIETANVSIAFLVNIDESPMYKDLTVQLSDDTKDGIFASHETIGTSDFLLTDNFGPVSFANVNWVNKIATAIIEVWRRGCTSGKAEKDYKSFVCFNYF